jgi:hypothetical protein
MAEATATTAESRRLPRRALNAAIDTFDVRITRTSRDVMQEPSPVHVEPEKWSEIERWLNDAVDEAIRARDAKNSERRAKWRKTLAGVRAQPAFRRGQSNLSVPLTIWASAAVRARVRAGTIESDPVVTVVPSKSIAGGDENAARDLVTFLTAEFRNPRALGGAQACDKLISDFVPMGLGGYGVFIEPDRKRYELDAATGVLNDVTKLGRVRHTFISCDDLIYPQGFGTDVQAMPFIGRQFTWSWQGVLAMLASGWLDDDAVELIKGQGADSAATGAGAHVAFQEHDIDEVYFDYPLFDDGLPVALMGWRHAGRKVMLGLQYSYAPGGRKPIWLIDFDNNPDPMSPEGQGVCEKLDGVQEETDTIHNLGIESAKCAIAHLVIIKPDTAINNELGADDPILPGTHMTDDTPDEAVKVVPMGSPDGMQAALTQEMNSLKYVMRMLGLDESALGHLESGKRVPASLGLEIKKDSRVITAHAIANFGTVMTEVFYYTLELYKLRLPLDTMRAAIGDEGVQLLQSSVFSANEFDLRSRYILNFNATDAAATEESRKQQLLVVGQYLQGYYDRVIQYAQLAMQLPPPLQNALMDVLQKMENGTRALLATIDDIKNPDDLLPKVANLAAALQSVATQIAGAPAGGGDLGGGVA